jgi:hypothetical protein
MIEVAGSSRRSFVFPAPLPVAYAYYADAGRLLSCLPHICLVRAYGPGQFRLRYHATELGVYNVHIYADVQTTLENGWEVRIHPLSGPSPIQGRADVHSCVTHGTFFSRSVFQAQGDQTRVAYSLQLRAPLPTPRALRFLPGTVLNRISRGITQQRIHEISEGFIKRSVDAFPGWLDELQSLGMLPEAGCSRIRALPLPT